MGAWRLHKCDGVHMLTRHLVNGVRGACASIIIAFGAEGCKLELRSEWDEVRNGHYHSVHR